MENLPRGFRQFLIRAKLAVKQAAAGAEDTANRSAPHDAHYEEEGGWRYTNANLGGRRLSGQETVWKDGRVVWMMSYCGRVTGEAFSGAFLDEALLRVRPDSPFRGPIEYQQGPLLYCNSHVGDMAWFYGREEMFASGVSVFECIYHGGVVA